MGNIGLFIDVANIRANGGHRLRYDVLRSFACRGGENAVRLNAYVTYDQQRAENEFEYRIKNNAFFNALRDYGYKVIVKEYRWYFDDEGKRFAKANADIDITVDLLTHSSNLDKITILTGDGDFIPVVRALQNKGKRVEVMGLKNVSTGLKKEADYYQDGYLVPGLLPVSNLGKKWGDVGSIVRGTCYQYDHTRNSGYIRFLKSISDKLWLSNFRDPEYPYKDAFLHKNALPPNVSEKDIPSRDVVFEFELSPPNKENHAMVAVNVERI